MSDRNGLLAKHDVAGYASEVVSFFSSASLQRNLRRAALDAGRTYSIDAMVGSFREGIRACLAWRLRVLEFVPKLTRACFINPSCIRARLQPCREGA